MQADASTAGPRPLEGGPIDFSVVVGGPLYRLYQRIRLLRPELDLLWRRIIGVTLISWIPPFLLALWEGRLIGGVAIPFLFDLEVHTRLLCSLPLLIGSEVIVHRRIKAIVSEFRARGIVTEEDSSKFDRLVNGASQMASSTAAEFVLLILAVTVGAWVWSQHHPMVADGSIWYSTTVNGKAGLTAAGFWYAHISLAILRFIMLRWVLRLGIWYFFLWRVRGLDLRLNLYHPDQAGGLGFLAASALALAPVLVSQTTMLAGIFGNRIWHYGARLPDFKMEILGFTILLIVVAIAPLTFFMVRLGTDRRTAKRELGVFASQYVEEFRRKWILKETKNPEDPLGSADIQSLADLANAYSVVSDMKMVPFSLKTIIALAIMIVLPFVPLVLTMVPLDQIVDKAIQRLLL